MNITLKELQKLFPKTTEEHRQAVQNAIERFNIPNKTALAAFLAQVGHESMGLTRFSENLNYSEEGLLKTFKKYFTPAQAKSYARQPEKIANRVYANRMGNGDEASGDGWRFRGAGAIQLTGKNNHALFAAFCERSVSASADYLKTIAGAIESAGWYFKVNNLMPLAEKGDMLTLTKRINGGTNGLEDRLSIFKKAMTTLAG